MRARGVAVPPTRPHASGRPLLCSCCGFAGQKEKLLSQGLPPPDPRFSPGAAAPRPPLLSQGLPPPDPRFFSTLQGLPPLPPRTPESFCSDPTAEKSAKDAHPTWSRAVPTSPTIQTSVLSGPKRPNSRYRAVPNSPKRSRAILSGPAWCCDSSGREAVVWHPQHSFFPRGCRPRTPTSFPGAAAPGPPLLSQGLPTPGPPLLSQGLPPPDPVCVGGVGGVP